MSGRASLPIIESPWIEFDHSFGNKETNDGPATVRAEVNQRASLAQPAKDQKAVNVKW